VAQSVHTAAPGFVGHMTSALPYISCCRLSADHDRAQPEYGQGGDLQGLTPLERQVLAMLHRLVYRGDDAFYQLWMHDSRMPWGVLLRRYHRQRDALWWLATASLPRPVLRRIAREGLARALQHLGCDGVACWFPSAPTTSFGKAADLSASGGTTGDGRYRCQQSHRPAISSSRACRRLQADNIRPQALVGIAGTTETGNVDPLEGHGDLARSSAVIFTSTPRGAVRPCFGTS